MPAINIQIAFPSEVVDSLSTTYQTASDLLKEAAVLELYREGRISGGKAAEILNMERFEFIRYAGMKGIPYIRISAEELNEEVNLLEQSQQ
jgi:predicted HTH domain antitoxin